MITLVSFVWRWEILEIYITVHYITHTLSALSFTIARLRPTCSRYTIWRRCDVTTSTLKKTSPCEASTWRFLIYLDLEIFYWLGRLPNARMTDFQIHGDPVIKFYSVAISQCVRCRHQVILRISTVDCQSALPFEVMALNISWMLKKRFTSQTNDASIWILVPLCIPKTFYIEVCVHHSTYRNLISLKHSFFV